MFPTWGAERPSWKVVSSSTTPTWALTARSSARLSRPSTWISPPSRRTRLRMHLMVVDLPAPFSPIRPMMVPPGTVKDTSSSLKEP